VADGRLPAPPSGGPAPHVVSVPLRRLRRWLAGFGQRHGQAVVEPAGAGWTVSAADGASARIVAPSWLSALGDVPVGTPDELAALEPAYGVLLIRRAGYAVAAIDGDRIVERKVGSRHIHGRTAAGGWSQQRYARRRGNQADEIAAAAAGAANRILGQPGPGQAAPAFLVTGGDRPLLAAARALLEPPVAELPVAMHLGVGTPDKSVVAAVPDRVRAVTIEIVEAATPG
jgi:hypothetical protein